MRRFCTLTTLALVLSISCHAADTGIRSMLVGTQILEVTDNRQMTLRSDGVATGAEISPDGRYVVYGIERKGKLELRLTKTIGGTTVTLMDGTADDEPTAPPTPAGESWQIDANTDVYWAPDSSRFAFRAIHRAWDGDQTVEKHYIVIFAARGAFLRSVPAPDGGIFPLVFGADSRTIYLNARLSPGDKETGQPRMIGIQSIDTVTGNTRTIYSSDALDIQILGLSDDGSSLLCQAFSKKGTQRKKIGLDGSSQDVTGDLSAFGQYSPDGSLAVLDGSGISIGSSKTLQKTVLTTDSRIVFERWAPNSKMLLYRQSEKIADVSGRRIEQPSSLWLTLAAPGKLNSMCIALDHEGGPSCSRDCRKIAYVCDGQLYIAELSLRDPSVDEKLASGLPLTEDETKTVLAANGKQIAVAMMMYSADFDGNLPPGDSLAGSLKDYLRDREVFLRPGGQDNIFTYMDPGVRNWSDVARPAETVIGELDAGYGWKVAIYADGHVVVKAK